MTLEAATSSFIGPELPHSVMTGTQFQNAVGVYIFVLLHSQLRLFIQMPLALLHVW